VHVVLISQKCTTGQKTFSDRWEADVFQWWVQCAHGRQAVFHSMGFGEMPQKPGVEQDASCSLKGAWHISVSGGLV
jgi:hypothetical protein